MKPGRPFFVIVGLDPTIRASAQLVLCQGRHSCGAPDRRIKSDDDEGKVEERGTSERFPYIAVYIMANRPLGTLYIGVTNDLPRRAYEHREGLVDGFTRRYGCKMLVWYEPHQMMAQAIRREKTLKDWNRVWKLELIERMNPEWRDLYATLNQ